MEKIILPESYKFISAFLTFRCNLDCSFCVNKCVNNTNNASGKKFKRNSFEEISGEKWIEALNRIESRKGVPVSFLGGEPSLHKDFIYILNNVKPELEIDIYTNLWWDEKKVDEFIKAVPPERIKRDAPYPSIRVSYHPEKMGEGEKLVENTTKLKEAGFDIGIECIMYPSPFQLEALERMAIRCKNAGISFRPKSYIGFYEGVDDLGRQFSITYGNYSKYSNSVLSKKTLECMCKTSDFLIAPSCDIYRCQRDLLLEENSVGNLLDDNFEVADDFKPCSNYGQCHLCDVKSKSTPQQELLYTSVEIKDVKWK